MKKIIFIVIVFSSMIYAQKKNNIAENHKGRVISSTEETNVTTYDFTTSSSKYYGTNGAKEIQSGVWGMIAGDANSDGVVDAVDKNSYWRVENGTTYEYSKYSDFNLDGNLDAVDKNSYWRPNNGKSTQVP